MKEYDVVIVGAGAAGLTAAIYTCRKKLSTLIISVDMGGQTILSSLIENYPGVEPMPGFQLMQKFEKQAKHFGAEIISGKVVETKKLKGKFSVILSNKEKYTGKTLILAFGKSPRTLGLPGEKQFIGRGISTCAVCDAPLYSNKTVAVIGGGNSALDATLSLGKIAKKIYLIHRKDEFRGDEILVDKVKNLKNLEIIYSAEAKKFEGDTFLKSMIIESLKDKKQRKLDVDGVFLEIGYEVKTDFLKGVIKLDKQNEIIVDERCRTSEPGIFAAGDVTISPFKQTVVSAGEGAKAALEAHRYLQGGKSIVSIDW